MLNDMDSPINDSPPDLPEFAELSLTANVPYHPDVLPDGRRVMIFGDAERYRGLAYGPDEAPYGFLSGSGILSCERLLNQSGAGVSERDFVQYAIERGLCNVTHDLRLSGGASPESFLRLLKDFGISAHLEQGASLEDLAHNFESGYGIIIVTNAGELYGSPVGLDNGEANCAVVVTGLVRDATAGNILGFYVHDGLAGKDCEFIDAKRMRQAWLDTGGSQVVTASV